MSKRYFVDTNILIDNPDAVEILSDNKQNEVYIHYQIINELDRLKHNQKLSHTVALVVSNLVNQKELFTLVGSPSDNYTDDELLNFLKEHKSEENILITSDKIFALKAIKSGIQCEEFKRSSPFVDITNGGYTGIVDKDKDPIINNCFFYDDDKKIYFNKCGEVKEVELNREIWEVKPKDIYQSLFFELGLAQNVDVMTVQGPAGTGKTFLSLALAFFLVFERKAYNKIYIIKPTIEIGKELGYLPGPILEKLSPYMEYIQSLIEKLNLRRKISKLYLDEEKSVFNNKKFQVLPINYLRGRDLEDAFVIVDETQNLSRNEIRTVLSRMGENIKCLCIGDKTQIDSQYLSKENNALNWILRKFKGEPNYAHLTMDSKYYRGPICELVVKTKL